MERNKYTFTKATEENCTGGGKICNVPYFEENEFVKFYGSLLTLFGEPQYSSDNFEEGFTYEINAKSMDGKEVFLWAYSGATGPAIGGPEGIAESDDVVRELVDLIQNTEPSDYDYSGYYLDGPCKINCGIKQGEIYFEEEELGEEELEEWNLL